LVHVQLGDLLIDGGNSHFADTDRRMEYVENRRVHFLGVGVSGGSEGARLGPSIMPGGSRKAYELVRPMFEAVAAKVDRQPCVTYLGNGSVGHYVKMVHNGIEYAMMQLIAESYDLMKQAAGLSNPQLQEIYERWNHGLLNSFLIEITARIFRQPDQLEGGDLVDKILDSAQQKGTGKWTSQHAMDVGIPVPCIDSAVTMRQMSGWRRQRLEASRQFPLKFSRPRIDADDFVNHMESALIFAMTASFAQGMSLLTEVSREKNYALDLQSCASIWRGGCIIRAALLGEIRTAFRDQPGLNNLLNAFNLRERILESHESCRWVVRTAVESGIPAMAFSSSLAYFDAFRAERLPLNLVQAQRDYFGSHTYERVDQDGIFHTEWTKQSPARVK
jgi:6-phosphogluconate dehydrogenase